MKIAFLFLVMAVGMINSNLLYADNYNESSDQVLHLVKQGQLLPLESIMSKYEGRLKGQLLDVEVEKEDKRFIYELELKREDGIVYEIKIDAQTGEWLEEEVEN